MAVVPAGHAMNGQQAPGIAARLMRQALYLGVGSVALVFVAAVPGLRWIVSVAPVLWVMAMVSVSVAAGFALRERRETQGDRFLAEIMRELEAERGRIRVADLRSQPAAGWMRWGDDVPDEAFRYYLKSRQPPYFHYHEASRTVRVFDGITMAEGVLESCQSPDCRHVGGRWVRPEDIAGEHGATGIHGTGRPCHRHHHA